ncbi:MAG: RDD family protein, partial [Microbacterium sp.]
LQLVGGGWVGLWRPIVRTLLLCLVIPAVIWDADQRGVHDKAAGTVLLRT